MLPSGEPVTAYTLTGAGGLSLTVMPFGGIVTRLFVPDRHGELADVVLGFDRLDDYLRPHPYFGAIVGRVAGRITGAKFTLDGRHYALAANESPNHLHGGVSGFDKKLWTVTFVGRQEGATALRLSRVSPDGEEGYPGAVAVSVTYRVTDDNRFVFETEATTDRPTPLSLTQHSYFNLSRDGGDVNGHELEVFADSIAAVDDSMALLGKRIAVDGLPADFRQPRMLSDVIPRLKKSHGDLYFLSSSNREPGDNPSAIAARLVEPQSGRVMTVNTDERCVQFYTGIHLNGTLIGKSGRPYGPCAGLCLECEGYPDGVNTRLLGNIVLRPGTTLRRTTEYAFTTV
jgi:aldose 1-epimerase